MQSLPRRLTRCLAAGEPFEQGMEYISLLDENNQRKDYCPACWEKERPTQSGHFWKGKILLRPKKRTVPDQHALELFCKTSDPLHRFILALYLERREQIVRRTHTLYEIPETGELFDVTPVNLSEEDSRELAQTLNSYFVNVPACVPEPEKLKYH